MVPEFSSSLDTRDICLRARTAVKSSLVEGLCVSGVMAGTRTPYEQLRSVKECVREAAVFANTGVGFASVAEILRIGRRFGDLLQHFDLATAVDGIHVYQRVPASLLGRMHRVIDEIARLIADEIEIGIEINNYNGPIIKRSTASMA